MKIANRRESPRIDIKLRCRVSSPAMWLQSVVYTENISRGGVLIGSRGADAAALPPLGQLMTVEIELPANHGFGQKCIHCQGMVIRVARPAQDGTHVALRLNYIDFRSCGERLRAMKAPEPVASMWMA